MILLAVNHHYVAEERPARPRAIFPTTLAELEREVEVLGRGFEFVSGEDVVLAVAGEGALPERSCLLTFDDGLRGQYELALPLLDRRGVPALFLVPGLPLTEGRALQVHKIHWLRERLGDQGLLARLGRRAADVDDERAQAMYGYDEPEAARLKYLLNVALPYDERDTAIDAVFDESEAEFSARLYMGAEQVAELGRRGLVGAHSFSHRPLSRLSDAELRDDLEANATVLAGATGERPVSISYPYGSPDAVDQRVAEAAEAVGFSVGFTMERAFNRSLEAPLLLARIDVNDAPGGAHPLLDLDGGEPRLRSGMAAGRARYVVEAVTGS